MPFSAVRHGERRIPCILQLERDDRFFQVGERLLDGGQDCTVIRQSLGGGEYARKGRGHIHIYVRRQVADGRRDVVYGIGQPVVRIAQLLLQGIKGRLYQANGRLLVGESVGKGCLDKGQFG